jgi:hypothetical protein
MDRCLTKNRYEDIYSTHEQGHMRDWKSLGQGSPLQPKVYRHTEIREILALLKLIIYCQILLCMLTGLKPVLKLIILINLKLIIKQEVLSRDSTELRCEAKLQVSVGLQ